MPHKYFITSFVDNEIITPPPPLTKFLVSTRRLLSSSKKASRLRLYKIWESENVLKKYFRVKPLERKNLGYVWKHW